MTHAQVELGAMIAIYVWLPICFLVFMYMMYRVYKKIAKKKVIQEATLSDRHKITTIVLWYSIPSIVLVIIMVIPTIYFNHLIKQDDYCLEVVRVNKITDINNSFLQERCSSFELNELIQRAYSTTNTSDEY